MEKETSDIVIFLGRFHPIILHLPIGFLFITFVLEILSRFKRFRQYKPAVGFTLVVLGQSAAIAASLAIEEDVDLHDLDYDLRDNLLKNRQQLKWNP